MEKDAKNTLRLECSILEVVEFSNKIQKFEHEITDDYDRCLISKGLLVLDSIRKYNKTLRYDVGDEFLDELKHTNSGEMPPNSIFVLYAYSRARHKIESFLDELEKISCGRSESGSEEISQRIQILITFLESHSDFIQFVYDTYQNKI